MPALLTDWKPATCLPDRCFCESVHAHGVAQPADTLSSLAFVLVAFMVALRSWKVRTPVGQNRIRGISLYSITFAGALFLIGVGSAFYHATLTFAGQTLDVESMYLIATFVLLYTLVRASLMGKGAFALSYIVGNAALFMGLFLVPDLRRYLFAALIIVGLTIEYVTRSRRSSVIGTSYLVGAVVTLAVAFGIWALDIQGIACLPSSLVQGHAIWHLLGALSAYLLYLYYDSERTSELKAAQ